MAEEMKPCPVCGEESVLMRPKKDNLIWDWLRKPAKGGCLVMCGNPSCSSKLHSFAVDPADAIFEWNEICDASIKPMPCPVCGHEPECIKLPSYFFICGNFTCNFAKHGEPNSDKDAAIKEWNKICLQYRSGRVSIPKMKAMMETEFVSHEEFVDFLGGEQE